MDFDFKPTPRKAVKFVVGHSTRFVISAAINAVVQPEDRKDRARLFIGTYALSGIVSDKVKEWVDSEIDDFVELYHDAKALFEDIKKEEQEPAQVHVITDLPTN